VSEHYIIDDQKQDPEKIQTWLQDEDRHGDIITHHLALRPFLFYSFQMVTRQKGVHFKSRLLLEGKKKYYEPTNECVEGGKKPSQEGGCASCSLLFFLVLFLEMIPFAALNVNRQTVREKGSTAIFTRF
jgi:hypothetical protein